MYVVSHAPNGIRIYSYQQLINILVNIRAGVGTVSSVVEYLSLNPKVISSIPCLVNIDWPNEVFLMPPILGVVHNFSRSMNMSRS